MKKYTHNHDIFKKSLGIVTKTLGKDRKTEVNFYNKDSEIKDNIVNLKNPPKNLSSKNLTKVRGDADSIASQIRYHNKKIHREYL